MQRKGVHSCPLSYNGKLLHQSKALESPCSAQSTTTQSCSECAIKTPYIIYPICVYHKILLYIIYPIREYISQDSQYIIYPIYVYHIILILFVIYVYITKFVYILFIL